MRRIGLLAVLAAALLVVATSATAARARHKASPKCPPGHSHLIAADAQAEVFTATQTILSDRGTPLGHINVYRGCAFGKARSFVLGPVASIASCSPRGCATEVSDVTLAGPLVAYERSFVNDQTIFERGSGSWTILVRDLRSGKVLRTVPTGENIPADPHYVGVGPASAIVLKRNGSVAWIAEAGGSPAKFEVHAVDHSGSRVLAISAGVDRSSLALAGSTLYWTEAGKPFSATLN